MQAESLTAHYHGQKYQQKNLRFFALHEVCLKSSNRFCANAGGHSKSPTLRQSGFRLRGYQRVSRPDYPSLLPLAAAPPFMAAAKMPFLTAGLPASMFRQKQRLLLQGSGTKREL
jgi:hypothetical protein